MLFFAQARCCECVRLTLLVTPSPGPYFWFLIEPDQASDINMCLNQLYCPTQPHGESNFVPHSTTWCDASGCGHCRLNGDPAHFAEVVLQLTSCNYVRWTEQPSKMGGRASAPPVFIPRRRLPRWQPATPQAPNALPCSGFPASAKLEWSCSSRDEPFRKRRFVSGRDSR